MNHQVKQSKTWISNGVETLFKRHADNESEVVFDTLIIGSGYGGAVAASELAGVKNSDGTMHSICVLERGKEFVPGSFPSTASELPTELRYTMPDGEKANGELDGLFDIRVGEDLSIVQANGLGGGSLINAGVLERPNESVFNKHWPQEISSISELEKHYDIAEKKLGAIDNAGEDNTIQRHAEFDSIRKYKSLEKLAPKKNIKPAKLSIAMDKKFKTSAGVSLNACVLCGNCATGCNHNSKNSLDVNLLRIAHVKGAEIFTGATVMKFEKKVSIATGERKNIWLVHVVYTQADLRKKTNQTLVVQARNIILAAGSLGSTELLKRSQVPTELQFSSKLGHRFSANGDMIVTGFNQRHKVNAISHGDKPRNGKNIGPTITGLIDNRLSNGILVEEMAVPNPISQLISELITTMDTIHSVGKIDWSFHSAKKKTVDPLGVNQHKLDHTSIYAAMGDDGASGVLDHKATSLHSEEGTIQVKWGKLRDHPIFETQLASIQKWTKMFRLFKTRIKGKTLPYPVWQTFPKALKFLTDGKNGPCLTVHPLGGCAMADDVSLGVVNHVGQVFDGQETSDKKNTVHDGLYILDGSIIPTALGINPALTISALAFRAIEKLKISMQVDSIDNFDIDDCFRPSLTKSAAQASSAQETELQMVERMSGNAYISDKYGKLKDVVIEISIKSDAKQFQLISKPGKPDTKINADYLDIEETSGIMQSETELSQIRIFEKHKWEYLRRQNRSERDAEKKLNDAADFIAPIKGRIHMFGREKSNVIQRIWRGFTAWGANRGLRDIKQNKLPKDYEPKSKGSIWPRIRMTFGGLSHAGETRTIKYDIDILEPIKSLDFDYFQNEKIAGGKRFIYSRKANPWKQLSELTLTDLPSGASKHHRAPKLSLDTTYLSSRGIPLLRITKQSDQISALLDLVSLGFYITRLMFLIHFWSFRKPDAVPPKVINRFADRAKGLPTPTIHTINVDTIDDDQAAELGIKKGDDVSIRLTHYAHPNAINRPILMIHGWGASSTTFAHHAIDNSLASYMYANQRDIWLVDLRTSAAMPTAKYPWTFEQVAECDIPHAINFIGNQYSSDQKMDVIAHCMGAVMLSMSILGPDKLGWNKRGKTLYQRKIKKIIMSQATPAVVLTPDNTFKGFMGGYLTEILPKNYEFRPTGKEQRLVDELTDRFLSTLPYPNNEFDRINPFPKFWRRVTYVQTRQRMDALYGRSFNLAGVSDDVLEHIDDLFGPLSLSLVNQIAHFARNKTATTRDGKNIYLTRENLKKKWSFQTFSIHSKNNGVIDFSTADRSQKIFDEAGCRYKSLVIKDEKFGHQDIIIGDDAHKEIFPYFHEFLSNNSYRVDPRSNSLPDYHHQETQAPASDFHNFEMEPPSAGPLILLDNKLSDHIKLGFGTNDAFGETPYTPLLLPVAIDQKSGRFLALGDSVETQRENINSVVTQWFDNQASSAKSPHRLSDDSQFARWMVEAFPKSAFRSENNKVGNLLIIIYEASPYVSFKSFGPNINMLRDSATNTSNIQIETSEKKKERAIPILNSTTSPHKREKQIKIISDEINLLLTDETKPPEFLKKGLVEYFIDDNNTKNDQTTTFAFSSCQYPNGIFDKEVSTDSFKLLNQYIEQKKQTPLSFLALLGDQVYTDPTAGLLDPTRKYDRYTAPYIRLYQTDEVRAVLRKMPVYNMLDDHEIVNNWEPISNSQQTTPEFDEGIKSFLIYQRGLKSTGEQSPNRENRLWYTFEHSNHHFFMMDTRTERKHRTASNINLDETTIVSSEQMSKLISWLDTTPQKSMKFILSSAMFLPRHQLKGGPHEQSEHALHSDGWDGYPRSFNKLLSHITENSIQNVVFLSGDEHMGCFAEATIKSVGKGASTKVYSIHSPGLYTPFPFANANRDDVEGQMEDNDPHTWVSEFEFMSNKTTFQCSVKTKFELDDSKPEPSLSLGRVTIKLIGGIILLSVRNISQV